VFLIVLSHLSHFLSAHAIYSPTCFLSNPSCPLCLPLSFLITVSITSLLCHCVANPVSWPEILFFLSASRFSCPVTLRFSRFFSSSAPPVFPPPPFLSVFPHLSYLSSHLYCLSSHTSCISSPTSCLFSSSACLSSPVFCHQSHFLSILPTFLSILLHCLSFLPCTLSSFPYPVYPPTFPVYPPPLLSFSPLFPVLIPISCLSSLISASIIPHFLSPSPLPVFPPMFPLLILIVSLSSLISVYHPQLSVYPSHRNCCSFPLPV
jgi:hypothetical protein